MDSYYSTTKEKLLAIDSALTKGMADLSELKHVVHDLLIREMELPKEEVDTEIINTCATLLDKLSGREAMSGSQKDAMLDKIKARISREQREKQRKKTLRYRGLAVAAIALIVVFVLGIPLESLRFTPSDDEQQYIVEGTVVNQGVRAVNRDELLSSMYSEELLDLSESLEIDIPVITWLPEGWAFDGCSSLETGTHITVVMMYCNEEDDYLLVHTYTMYSDLQAARKSYEQNSQGEETKTPLGKTVYVAENMENPVAMWHYDAAIHSISGPLTKDDMLKVIDSISYVED